MTRKKKGQATQLMATLGDLRDELKDCKRRSRSEAAIVAVEK